MGECKAGTRLTMNPYIPLWIGGATAVVALVLMFTPTECFVMQNDNYERLFEEENGGVHFDVLKMSYNPDGSIKLTKKIHSELEKSDIIVVKNPPNTILEAIMFWADDGATTIPHDRVRLRSYHIECSDPASQIIKRLYPSAFPNSVHESIALKP